MIATASGWYASYMVGDRRWYEPIIIWKDITTMRPMVIGMVRKGSHGILERADEVGSFIGYVTEEEMKGEESCDEMD